MSFAQEQVRKIIQVHPNFYPMHTEMGRWRHDKPVWTHWCDGFLPGMMWIFHRYAGPGAPEADWWMDQAIRYTRPLESRKADQETHDLGFIFIPTYLRWYQVTRQKDLDEVLITAGQTLALRYQERGQYLRSFVAENSIFIDIMMNIGLVFYAARQTGDRMLRDIAVRHSLTT